MLQKPRNGFATKQPSDEKSNGSALIWGLCKSVSLTHLSFITSASDFHSLNILWKNHNECVRHLAQIS